VPTSPKFQKERRAWWTRTEEEKEGPPNIREREGKRYLKEGAFPFVNSRQESQVVKPRYSHLIAGTLEEGRKDSRKGNSAFFRKKGKGFVRRDISARTAARLACGTLVLGGVRGRKIFGVKRRRVLRITVYFVQETFCGRGVRPRGEVNGRGTPYFHRVKVRELEKEETHHEGKRGEPMPCPFDTEKRRGGEHQNPSLSGKKRHSRRR